LQKHSMLHNIAEELGAPKTSPYPDDRYDIVWTLKHHRIVKKESEQCPGIDRPSRKGKKDPDLEIPARSKNAEEEDAEEDGDYEVDGEEEEEDELDELEDLDFEGFPSFLPPHGQLRLADLN
jgi:hypothetical protein